MAFSSDKITSFSINKTLKCGHIALLCDKPLVMGILNLTPDSFYDGGQYLTEVDYVARTEKMIIDGASIIDIGAVSTRPGASEVNEATELERLLPALQALTKRFPDTIFSIDTFRANVAKSAAQFGAGMINDISGGNLDENMFTTVAEIGLPYVLMHIQGTPSTMQDNPDYENIINNINQYFSSKLNELDRVGVEQVILDPGFGFGKTIHHNFNLLHHLSSFKTNNYPLMVGLSRKSMIYKLLDILPKDALPSTSALQILAVINGVDILRVHDVKEAVQVIKLAEAYTTAL